MPSLLYRSPLTTPLFMSRPIYVHVVKPIIYRISSIKLCNDDVLYCTVMMNLGGSGT